jgi:hypothetical protein
VTFLHSNYGLLGFLSIHKPIYLLLEIHALSCVYTYPFAVKALPEECFVESTQWLLLAVLKVIVMLLFRSEASYAFRS